jgi:arylsulfatase A-like enzyme
MQPASRRKRLFAILAVVAAVWAITALWLVPWVIRSAYAGESFAFLNALISGQGEHGVERYLTLWTRWAWRLTLIGPVAAGVLLLAVRLLRRVRREQLVALLTFPPVTPGASLTYAIWIGLIGGLAEAVNGIVRPRVQHLPTGEVVSGELLWMAPLAAATYLVLVTLLLIGIGYAIRRPAAVRLAPPLCAGLAAFGLLRAMAVGIAWVAAVFVGIAVATLMSRQLRSRPERLVRIAWRSSLGLAVILVVWGLTLPFWRNSAERRALASLPTPPTGAPNVLILIWDTARALNLSLYGYDRKTTPSLERFATRGAVFDRAVSTSSWSLPAHASIFTGRYPHEMTAGRRLPLDEMHPTLAEVLSRRGYVTGGFTANLFYGSADYGIARGFVTYDSRPPIKATVIAHTWFISRATLTNIRYSLGDRQTLLRRNARHVNSTFLNWTERHRDRPFFAVLNNFDAHEPYRAPAPFDTAFTKTSPRYWFDAVDRSYTDEEENSFRDAYDTCLLYLDSELDRLIAGLEERGVLDNTLVIVTSDHGEEFGEAGPNVMGHARSINYASLRVPLVVRYPKSVPAGRRGETVSLRDIPATVMDVIAPDEPHPFPGHSLAAYARGLVTEAVASEPRLSIVEKHTWANRNDTWPAALGHLFSVASDNLHFVVDGRGKEHLYDIDNDVWSLRDLIDAPDRAADVTRLRSVLDSLVGPANGPRKFRALFKGEVEAKESAPRKARR